MDLKKIGLGAAIIFLLVIVGGVGYKIIAPTSKTIVGQGGKVITINTERPKEIILRGGCAIYRANFDASFYWLNPVKQEASK